jgi:hypothetical protein
MKIKHLNTIKHIYIKTQEYNLIVWDIVIHNYIITTNHAPPNPKS